MLLAIFHQIKQHQKYVDLEKVYLVVNTSSNNHDAVAFKSTKTIPQGIHIVQCYTDYDIL